MRTKQCVLPHLAKQFRSVVDIKCKMLCKNAIAVAQFKTSVDSASLLCTCDDTAAAAAAAAADADAAVPLPLPQPLLVNG